jgi:exopolysaccharide/PEP-CTERM locus tyrosine autokinase
VNSSIEKAIARLTPSPEPAPLREAASSPVAAIHLKRDTEQTEQALLPKLKPKLELNWKALGQAGYLTPNTLQTSFAEEYRLIKRALLINASAGEINSIEYGNLIAIISAVLGEGKTFTTFNLALSIATGWDNTVLVVDADLDARTFTELVGLREAPGLTDVLLDPMLDLEDVMVQTTVPGLRILPAGRRHPDGTELLASEQMQGLAHELSGRYSNRIVLFDTPPLLASTQSLVLSSLAGQILVVVEEGKTPQKTIKEAIALLGESKAIGMVLNKCGRWSDGLHYGRQNGLSN